MLHLTVSKSVVTASRTERTTSRFMSEKITKRKGLIQKCRRITSTTTYDISSVNEIYSMGKNKDISRHYFLCHAHLLPSARVSAERLCFHKRLSFCPQGGGGVCLWVRGVFASGSWGCVSASWSQGVVCLDTPSQRPPRQTSPQQTLTPGLPLQRDGTHPTGLHSCFVTLWLSKMSSIHLFKATLWLCPLNLNSKLRMI